IANQAAGGQRTGNISVRELLDRASQRIEGKFLGQEETEAAIRRTLGRAYQALGEYPLAQKHLERSFALRKHKLGESHADTLGSMDSLALLYMARGRHDEAEDLFKRILDVRRAELGPDHPSTLQNMNSLALLYWERGRYDEAGAMHEAILARRRER